MTSTTAFSQLSTVVVSTTIQYCVASVPSDASLQMPALIPLLDMANHKGRDEGDSQDNVSVNYCPVNDVAGCTATDDYVFGQEVTIFYGMRSNGDHLLHNGFVPDDNANDYVRVRLGNGWSCSKRTRAIFDPFPSFSKRSSTS